jgi:hypothetical protein
MLNDMPDYPSWVSNSSPRIITDCIEIFDFERRMISPTFQDLGFAHNPDHHLPDFIDT